MGNILILSNADFSNVSLDRIDFDKKRINVVISTTEGGTTSGSGSYENGDIVTITATPSAGYVFSKWSDGSTDATRVIRIEDTDIALTAYFASELSGWGKLTIDGTEDWQFNSSSEPNTHGYYNCYLLSPDVANAALSSNYNFADAYCDNNSLNRNIIDERRDETTQAGFGYLETDPSIFFRFNSEIATSVDEWKAYLVANPITIYYELNK